MSTLTRIAVVGIAAAATIAGSSQLSTAATSVTTSSGVGDGWSVVTVGKSGASTYDVRLVSPTGVQTKLTTIRSTSVVADASLTGKRLVIQNWTGNVPVTKVWDNGVWRAGIVSQIDAVKFTKPTGANLLVHKMRNTNGALSDLYVQRTDFSGKVLATFRGAVGPQFVQTTDGTMVIGSDARGRISVSNNATGGLIRTMAVPSGYHNCWPLHMKDAGTVVSACMTSITQSGSKIDVFTYKVGGGTATPITKGLSHTGIATFGYLDAWWAPAGLLVGATPPCGSAPVGVVKGSAVKYLTDGERQTVVDVVGNNLYILNGEGCGAESHALVTMNATTKATKLLAGGTKNPGLLVTNVVVLDKRN